MLVAPLLVMIMSNARITLNRIRVPVSCGFREAFSQARAILNLKPNDKIASGGRNAQIKNRNCLKGLSKTSSAVFTYPSRASEAAWIWSAGAEL